MSVKQTYQWMEKAASVNDLAQHLLPLFSGADKKEWKPILGIFAKPRHVPPSEGRRQDQ